MEIVDDQVIKRKKKKDESEKQQMPTGKCAPSCQLIFKQLHKLLWKREFQTLVIQKQKQTDFMHL